MQCKICGREATIWDSCKVLGLHQVSYYRCKGCGFIQTEEPYWLDEAYSSAIADTDIGLVGRNVSLAILTGAILKFCLPNSRIHLDYGGGTGLFVRLMRDAGFDFEWYDRYCDNFFAKNFVKKRAHYDVVTAFELLEHLPHPLEDLAELMALGDNVICSTSLVPSPVPKVADWWYYAPETGQHIAFYTEAAMKKIAAHFGRYYVHCSDLHIFSCMPIPMWKLKICMRFPRLIGRLKHRESLLAKDYEALTGKKLS